MCGGNDSPPAAPVIAAPPPPPEILDTIDEITGTETVTATDPATGKKKRITRSLPLSQEQQAILDRASQLMDTSIGEMNRLYTYGPQNIVDFAPFVETFNNLNAERTADMQRLTQIPDFTSYVNEFKTMQRDILNEEFETRANQLQEELNRTGYANSTASRELKSALAKQQSRANQQLGVDAMEYGQNLYDRDLGRRSQEFGFREATRQGREASARTAYGLEKEYKDSLEQQRQMALTHQKNLYGIGESIKGAHTAKQLQTMAPRLALAEFQATDQSQMNHYNAEVNRTMANYNMQMQNHNAQPPSFGQQLMTVGGQLAGAYLGGPGGAAAGGALANNIQSNPPVSSSFANFSPQVNNIMRDQVGVIRR